MGNTKLIFTVCLLAIVSMSAGMSTGENFLNLIGLFMLACLSVAFTGNYLYVACCAQSIIDDCPTKEDVFIVSKAKAGIDKVSAFAEMAIFTGAGMLSLFAGGVVTPIFMLSTLVSYAAMSKWIKKSCAVIDSKTIKANPVTTSSLKAAAASGAATLAANETQADPLHDPFNPLNPANVMHQVSMAESLSVHATNNDSVCYSQSSNHDTSTNYSSNCDTSSSYSSSDSGSSSSW